MVNQYKEKIRRFDCAVKIVILDDELEFSKILDKKIKEFTETTFLFFCTTPNQSLVKVSNPTCYSLKAKDIIISLIQTISFNIQ